MIEIVGTIKNAVDCGCYEVEAVPVPDPELELDACDCRDSLAGASLEVMPSIAAEAAAEPEEVTHRVKVDAKRGFAIRVEDVQLTKWFAGRTPYFRLRVYMNGALKLTTARSFAWTRRRKASRPLVVDLCAPPIPPPCGKVCGKVTDCRGKPLAWMRVHVYDVDLYDAIRLGKSSASAEGVKSKRKPPMKIGTLLGETVTNECGEYCLCYRYKDYAAGDIRTADIRVVVGPAEGRFRPLQVSDIQFNASTSLSVDLTVPGSELDGSGEFIEYHRKLHELGCATRDKRSNLTDDRLEFASREAEIPIEHLVLLRQAYVIDREFLRPLEDLPDHVFPQIIYGLLRMGVTDLFPTWARNYADPSWNLDIIGHRLGALLDSAVKRCVIDRGLGFAPGPASTKHAGLVVWIFSFFHALNTPLLPNRSSWFDLFNVFFQFNESPNHGLFVKFGLAWLRFGIGERMWTELDPVFGATAIKRLKQLAQWAEISGFYAPAVSLFDANPVDLEAAVESDMLWRSYFTASRVVPAPAGVAFADYAAEVLERARAEFGTVRVAAWAGGVVPSAFPPSLGLSVTNARRAAERLSRLTTSADFASRLAEKGFTSARDIAALRWQDFIARLGEPEGSIQALYAYTKARETHAVSFALTLQLAPALASPIEGLPVPFLAKPILAGSRFTHVPQSVFGSGSECDCEGRQSIFSPAAYLYSLRRFLANVSGAGVVADGRTLLDSRRPEMADLKLSYTNSHAIVPTIDLNNEVLEDLAGQMQVDRTLVPMPAPRQTSLDANELALKPEYENGAVYDALAAATLLRPWRFPFDLRHAKRRVYLDAMGLAREEILRLAALAPTTTALSDAVLDLNPGQRTWIETAVSTAVAYGAGSDLSKSETMMDRTQLGFQDLYGIMQLVEIYSGASPNVYPEVDGGAPESCSPSSYEFNDKVYPPNAARNPISATQADRIHRFTRLWRALPWPMHLLDWAIGAFVQRGQVMFPLEWLGMAELIRKRLKLKPHEAIAFWADLSTRPWKMPFVNAKPVLSPWEQVFRSPFTDLTLAAAARLAGISQQFADMLLAGAPFTEPQASKFFRYGRLAKAMPGLLPEDIRRYAELIGVDVFLSPADTWDAIEDFDVVRRSGSRIAAALPCYLSPSDPATSLERREMLAVVEQLNRRARAPQGPFESALVHFVPESTASVVVAKLADYVNPTSLIEKAANAELDELLAGLLSLPRLLTPPLSAETGATEAAKDLKRKDRILSELSHQLWDRGIAAVLCKVSSLDTQTARLLAESVTTSNALTVSAGLKALVGDGGVWVRWPAGVRPLPGAQPQFLDEGVLNISSAAVAAGFSVALKADLIASVPGGYQVRVRAAYDSTTGTIDIDGNALPPGEARLITPVLTVKEKDSQTQQISFDVTANVACKLRLELVDPSGNVQPLTGDRLYSDSAAPAGTVASAMEGLELMALAGTLAKQWKLGAADLAALSRLQKGSAIFPVFPPTGSPATARPLAANDAAGFSAWLAYARLVAALKMARGPGRQMLFDSALLAQSGGTPDEVWAGVARALELEPEYVGEAAGKLGLGVVDFGQGRFWLKLFDLSRALQRHGVSADTLESWGAALPGDSAAATSVVASVEAAARAALREDRSGYDQLRKAADRIRVLKRDVLSDFLLATPPIVGTTALSWTASKDISDYLLTDIEMEPCAETSRVRFAIASVQRLVTQALAQAEPLILTADQELEWQSIFQYRLWEVRQKILLYPENWLKFGRHLHRSREFEEMERALLQGDLTEEKAGEELTGFVEKLHEIGHLEAVGSCVQQEYDATGAVSLDLLHVVGRTPAEPRAYYHRTRVDGAYWTPWQKIEIDIDCDQVVPMVHNRQLHLFWLVPETIAQEKPDIRKDDRQIPLDDKYMTLRLAWSVLTSKGWRAKKLGKSAISTRFGHYAANPTTALASSSPYVEVHAWNQAVQDLGSYQLRPALSDEGDAVIEVFASLESTLVAKVDRYIPDWVYDARAAMNRWGAGEAWYAAVYGSATSYLNTHVNTVRTGAATRLRTPTPALPAIATSGVWTVSFAPNRLIGTFRLRPDNLVETRERSTEFDGGEKYLTPAERGSSAEEIGDAVSRSGAFEFDDGSVELYAGGAFRTVLSTAGKPVRVVITRQEMLPSQRDPVFCRIKNRGFFAFKNAQALPPAVIRVGEKKPSWKITNAFQTTTREHVEFAARRSGATAMAQRVGYGMALATGFAVTAANSVTAALAGKWRFALAHHPQTIELLRAVKAGIDRLYTRETQEDPRGATGSLSVPFEFAPDYQPVASWVDTAHLPEDALEFKPDQAYAVYNWELLYHAPMLVSQQLARVGRFDEARRWVAHVFNPRDPAVRDSATGQQHPENFWVFKPFVDLVRSVSGGGLGDFDSLDPADSSDLYTQKVFRALIRQWRASPYNPHAVAAFRPQAYQLAAVIFYVETMLAWGDSLFGAPSAELVEDAARRYEEAERVIGRPPLSTGAIRYDAAALSVAALDSGGALASPEVENAISVGDGPSPHVEDAFLPDLGLGYFCLPPNPKIKELRDRIQDRLFKVHHCLDLLGNPRRLPLYDPPIDPSLLADAAMAGLNVSQAVMDAYTPRPHYRFRTLVGLAKGMAQHVTSLGAGLLAAMEKRDAESLALLKATHEGKALERATALRKLQVEDAQAGIQALEATHKSVAFRREFYESREFMNAEEEAQIVLSVASTVIRIIGQGLNAASSAASAMPDFAFGAAGWAASPVAVTLTGGENVSRVPAGLGRAMDVAGEVFSTLSQIVGSMGSFRRRKEDWDFQAKSAALEMKQISAQILGARIRQTIAERELTNHEAQLEQSRDELDFIRTKQTSVSLYEWLAADIGASYYRAYQLGHSMALQAQRALQDELGSNERYIGYSYWDGARNGLQAGERLMLGLLEMESEYHNRNALPVLKTMTVSLALLDPIALATLKVTGSCSFALPEAFWDRCAPGLYFRRFASVSISVPAVTGPFGGVHGRLSIEHARYRKDASLPDDGSGDTAASYARQGPSDARFVDQFPRPGDFIVLSTGNRDSGVGGDAQREDRYRPFENLGVDSEWRLEISQRDNSFDLSTIANVELHVEYTARDGGKPLTDAARAEQLNATGPEGFLVSFRHQFPTQWQALRTGAVVQIDLAPLFSASGMDRASSKLASIDLAFLLRAKEQPEVGAQAQLAVTAPESPSHELGGACLPPIGDVNVTFKLPGDGGLRFGLGAPLIDLEDASDDVFFANLYSDPWTIGVNRVGGIEPEDLEDVIIAVSWRLGGASER